MMNSVLSIIFMMIFVLLQTTLMHHIAIEGVIPDLSLIVLIFLANRNGRVTGETAGFAGGLVEDFLSLSPMGFHALMKTVIGFLYGYTFGVVFIGSLLMPMLMVGIASLIKAFLASVIIALFQVPGSIHSFFSWQTMIEVGYNMILSPFMFAFLGIFKFLLPRAR